MSSKGGSTTSAQSIPDWLRDPTVRNLDRAEQAASIGYQPYYGPDVAAFNPTQNQGFQNTQNALASFGMAPRGSQVQTGMPPTINAGGVSGYASSPMYEQAVAELAVRDPNQMARYGALYNPNINPNNLTKALNNQQKPYGFDTGGDSSFTPPNPDFAKNAEFYAANPNLGNVMRNIHSAMYSGPIGQFAKYAQDPWAKTQDHNFIASTFGMSPNDSAYSENVVDSTNGAIATPVPSMSVFGTPLSPFDDDSENPSGPASGDAAVSGANSEASHEADGNNPGSGGTSSGDAGVSGANSESSHGADGNNSGGGGEGGGGGGGGGDSGGSHICTATFNHSLISASHFKSLNYYGARLRKKDPYLMRAYDSFGPKLAFYVGKNKLMTQIAKFMTSYWKDTSQNHKLTKKQYLHFCLSACLLRPMARVAGWILIKFVDKK